MRETGVPRAARRGRVIRKRSSEDQLRKLKTSKLVRVGTSNNKHSVRTRRALIFPSRRDVSERSLRLHLTEAEWHVRAMKENECIFLAHCRLACRSVNLHTWRDQTARCFASAEAHSLTLFALCARVENPVRDYCSSSIKLNSCGLARVMNVNRNSDKSIFKRVTLIISNPC